MQLITLFLTCANKAEADRIVAKLLDDKLITCSRRVAVSSDYWWKGKQERANEIQLIMESAEDKFDQIEATVSQFHSYEMFTLTAYPVIKASRGVEHWVKEDLK